MIRNNKELKRSLILLSCICLALTVCGFLHSSMTGLLILAAGLAVCLIFLFTELSRYKKLQSFSEHLGELLRCGTPLSIRDYEEGELSLLADNIQKITLLLKERADALQKDKGFLADALADISHQLRTPLTTMNLTIGLLQEKDLSKERRAALTRELNALLSRTEWLVEALLKLSRLDAEAVVMAKEEISVRELTEKAAGPLLIPLELKGFVFRRPELDGRSARQYSQKLRKLYAGGRQHPDQGRRKCLVYCYHGNRLRSRDRSGRSAAFV